MEGANVLLGVTGGIAAYKTPELVRQFKKAGAHVQVVVTKDALHFVTKLSLSTVSERPVYASYFNEETGEWVNHVHLAEQADFMLIAPLTSNTLAKMAHGFCDNLLLATYLSATCPIWVAPAMDRDMYQHPAVQANMRTMEERGHQVIGPEEGELASGQAGKGRMTEPEDLVNTLKSHSPFS